MQPIVGNPPAQEGTRPEPFELLEYCSCLNPDRADCLYEMRDFFRTYWNRHTQWLQLAFDRDRGEPQIRASHYVGLLPFQVDKESHIILVAPKGCAVDFQNGLLQFLNLLAICEGQPCLSEMECAMWRAQSGVNRLLLFLAFHYGRSLRDLCRSDFRLYYRAEEGVLSGRLRGRLHVAGHMRNVLSGRAHQMPCRWEEFTSDNWDNRILLGTARKLERVAADLGPGAVYRIQEEFRPIEHRFSAVEEVPVRCADFSKTRLWRTSQHYRHALDWARLILQGMDRPAAGGQASPLVLDANAAFERFAEVVVQAAIRQIPGMPYSLHPQVSLPFLTGPQAQDRRPDLLIRNEQQAIAVGDAKYKDVLEGLENEYLGNLECIVPRITPNDWNQLYVYMRLTESRRGFFLVPFWKEGDQALVQAPSSYFTVGPLDNRANFKVAVFGLNMLRPAAVLDALGLLVDWLR